MPGAGAHEGLADTGTLIDNAVKTLNDKMEEMEHMLMDIKMSTAAAAARAPGPK